jgi:hypothetical protein
MDLLLGYLRTLRLRLSGPGEPLARFVAPLVSCVHSWDYCGWRLGPKGKYAWLTRCTRCGAWYAC